MQLTDGNNATCLDVSSWSGYITMNLQRNTHQNQSVSVAILTQGNSAQCDRLLAAGLSDSSQVCQLSKYCEFDIYETVDSMHGRCLFTCHCGYTLTCELNLLGIMNTKNICDIHTV